MTKNIAKRFVAVLAAASLLSSTLPGVANAAMVGTGTAINMEQRAEYVSDIRAWLNQEKVRDQLVAMGVDPDDAGKRVAGMTGEELRTLHERIENLPAGAGVVAVIGIVFIVLLILELVGVTHVFSNF